MARTTRPRRSTSTGVLVRPRDHDVLEARLASRPCVTRQLAGSFDDSPLHNRRSAPPRRARAARRPASGARDRRSIRAQSSSWSARPPSAEPISSSSAVERMPRRPACRRAMPSSSRSSSSGSIAHVRVRADAERDRALAHGGDAEKAVTEIGLGRGAGADARPGAGEQIELVVVLHVCACTIVVRAVRQPVSAEKLDRAAVVLFEALLDLARLLTSAWMCSGSCCAPRRHLRSPRASRGSRARTESGARARPQCRHARATRHPRDRRRPRAGACARDPRAGRRRGAARSRYLRPTGASAAAKCLGKHRGHEGIRRRPCTRPHASPGTPPRTSFRPDSGVAWSASSSMAVAPRRGTGVPESTCTQRPLEGVAVRC